MNTYVCPICGSDASKIEKDYGENRVINCNKCGEFKLTETFEMHLKKKDTIGFSDRVLLSHELRKIYDQSKSIYSLDLKSMTEINKNKQLPNIMQQSNNLILFLGKSIFPSSSFLKNISLETLMATIGSYDENEFLYLERHLHENNLIGLPAGNSLAKPITEIGLTYKGWNKYENLYGEKGNSNRVFIAMWFDEITKELRESFISAVSKAGYEPVIVDEQDFTGNIIDYILAQIQMSKFVIADFTSVKESDDKGKVNGGVRGGIYYEAGYAKGLGLQVIHTCKNDFESKRRLHFDIKQENTLFWGEKEVLDSAVGILDNRGDAAHQNNFAVRVYDRIVNLFGYGENIK